MNPQTHSELPPIGPSDQYAAPAGAPSGEAFQTAVTAGETAGARAVESAASTSPGPVPIAPLLPTTPVSAPIGQPAVALPAAALPQIADDTDLIEKEWVVKAKEIVARTRQDPYQQNKQVELMKADYMKKRYNKEVKLTDD